MNVRIKGLTREEVMVFENFANASWENAFSLDKFSGCGVKDMEKRQKYMNLFEENNLYKQDEDGDYMLTAKGLRAVNRL